MNREPAETSHEKVAQAYFHHIRDLRSGKSGAVEQLLDLWDEDGTFEFAGSPPVTGTFQGRNALQAFYKNRLQSQRMTVKLESAPKGHEVALQVVDSEPQRIKADGDTVVAHWTTVVGTQDGRGFQVAGTHTFSFRNGRISGLKVIVSPRPEKAEKLKFEGLTVDDIGRLSLAAWAIV